MGNIGKIIDKGKAMWEYVADGVWKEPDNTMKVRLIKILNLSVRSFTNRDLQSRSQALTYITVLAIVPALALLMAIARGFGLQDIIVNELYHILPSQQGFLEKSMTFVDRYLSVATQGVFIGVGVILLLWTLISLMSNIDDTFNKIWGITRQRSIYRKISDYLALCLIVPLLMMLSAGVSIFISTLAQSSSAADVLTPMVNVTLEAAPLVLAWLAFTFCYFFIPNGKVQFRYAAISGAFAAIGFWVIQYLFVNGQIYVSKYNAIYGSFALLPLLLVWLQLSWLIMLSGCVLTCSMQNVMAFDFTGKPSSIAPVYRRKLQVAVMAVIANRAKRNEKPLTTNEICADYNLPSSLVQLILGHMHKAGLVYYVLLDNQEMGVAPAFDLSTFTVDDLMQRVDRMGYADFVPYFNAVFSGVFEQINEHSTEPRIEGLLLRDLDVPTPEEVRRIIEADTDEMKE